MMTTRWICRACPEKYGETVSQCIIASSTPVEPVVCPYDGETVQWKPYPYPGELPPPNEPM